MRKCNKRYICVKIKVRFNNNLLETTTCVAVSSFFKRIYYFLPFIASSKNFPGLNFTVVLGLIITGSPVLGLRAKRLV